jgi:glyoxylase-like metal-dependent hydrolase (beta-lactamase superfamily II)
MQQQIIEITKEIYCIYTPSYFNCTYLIKRNGKIILIDTGMRSDAKDIKFAMKKLSLSLSDITAILLTHWHNDHSAGTSELKKLTGCETFCHINEAKYFEKTQSSKIRRVSQYIPEYGILVLFKGLIGDVVPRNVKIDHLVKDGDIILDTFEVIHTKGHTEGHISFYDTESKFLFAGDSLAVIDQKLRLMARPVTPDKESSIISIKRSLANRKIKGICPGHRESLIGDIDSEINNFIDSLNKMEKWPLLG